MTAGQIDRIMEEVRTFGDRNFGLQNGWDFPEFAKALSESDKFKTFVSYISASILLQMLNIKADADHNDTEKIMSSGNAKKVVAQALYIGYRIGQELTETRQLEKMAK